MRRLYRNYFTENVDVLTQPNLVMFSNCYSLQENNTIVSLTGIDITTYIVLLMHHFYD